MLPSLIEFCNWALKIKVDIQFTVSWTYCFNIKCQYWSDVVLQKKICNAHKKYTPEILYSFSRVIYPEKTMHYF